MSSHGLLLKILAKSLFVVLIAIGAISLTINNCKECFVPGAYGYVKAQKENKKEVRSEKNKYVLIGDSLLGSSFSPNEMPNTRSLATPGATYIESFFQLRDFLKNNPAPEKILLATVNHPPVNRQLLGQLYIAEGYFSREDIDQIYADCLKKNDFPMIEDGFIPAKYRFWMYYHLHRINFFFYYIRSIRENLPVYSFVRQGNDFIYKLVKPLGSYAIPGFFDTGFPRIDYMNTDYRPRPVHDEYLMKIHQMTKEAGAELVVLELPQNEDWFKQADGKRKRIYYNNFYKHQKKLTESLGIPTISLYDGQNKTERFLDPVHFNADGAAHYSSLLRKLLEGE